MERKDDPADGWAKRVRDNNSKRIKDSAAATAAAGGWGGRAHNSQWWAWYVICLFFQVSCNYLSFFPSLDLPFLSGVFYTAREGAGLNG